MKTNLIIVAFIALLVVFAVYVASEDIQENDNVNGQELDLQRAAISTQEDLTEAKFTPTIVVAATVPVVTTTNTPSITMSPIQVQIAIRDGQFQPHTITIQKGTTVIWQNQDTAIHYVDGQDTQLLPALESSPMRQGDDFFYTFSKTGEYNYSSGKGGSTGLVSVVN